MILDDIADGPDGVVERSTSLDAEVLRHGDLHALDVVAVPERLEQRVDEAEEDHVVDLPLPEIVINPEDRALVEGAAQDVVQCLCRGKIVTERLLDDDPRTGRTARSGQLLHHRTEQRGRDGEVVRGPLGGPELAAQGIERRRIAVVAVNILEQAGQFLERHPIEPSVFFHAIARAGTKLLEGPAGPGHTDHRHVELTALRQRLKRRKDLLVGQIAGGAEKDQRI